MASDFAALRRLRDDDASGALKEKFGDGEDPREWDDGDAVTVADGRVTKLIIYKCDNLAALPAAIGELKALRMLDLSYCSHLVALPESIAGLDALTALRLGGCDKLTFPPPHTHGDLERVQRLLANTTRFLDDGLSAADAARGAVGRIMTPIKRIVLCPWSHSEIFNRVDSPFHRAPARGAREVDGALAL